MRVTLILLAAFFISFVGIATAEPNLSLSVSKGFFNPTLGEKVKVTLRAPVSGTLTLQVIDRDGFVTRTLATNKAVSAGSFTFDWDGRNATEIVPDEAYSFRAELTSGRKKYVYFPANAISKDIEPKVAYYDRQTGTLSYELSKPARVHAQAGCAKIDPVTKKPIGPVLRTIVQREPRVAGTISEHWNGFAEDGFTYVPDLPDFVVAVAATSLPEDSVITVGNRTGTFLSNIPHRSGASLFTFSVKDHHHHQGLSTLQDISPHLAVRPLNAEPLPSERAWMVSTQESLILSCNLEGITADAFFSQPGILKIFVDGHLISEKKPDSISETVKIPLQKLPVGLHLIAVNWGSEYGPAAVNLVRLKVNPDRSNAFAGPSKE